MASESPQAPAQAVVHDARTQQQQPLENKQPAPLMPMDPQRPQPESDLNLRGGDRGGCCPGRFCFCIPCCIPCDCCIIPL